MRGGGIALKFLQAFLRFILFCCAAVILAIFSYFLATLHNHDLPIATWIRAVEGISGAAVFYSIVGLLLLWCLAGLFLTSAIAILLDIAFTGAFIYIAWETRHGAGSCSGDVNTPFGSGNTDTSNTVSDGSGGSTVLPSLRTACKLETACFAVSIIAIIFFLLAALVELALVRHHKKEKAFGPGPSNNYTAGSPKRKFWQRKSKKDAYGMTGGLKPDSLPSHATPADVRTSYATDTTAVGTDATAINKYGNATSPTHSSVVNNAYKHDQHQGVVDGGTGYTRTHQPYNQTATYNQNTTGTF